jgi:signal transduction histidine kinase
MGVPNSAGQAAPRGTGRSIRYYFAARLAAPVACLLLLWALVTGAALGGRLDRLRWPGSVPASHRVLVESAVVVGAGLVVVLGAVVLMGSFAIRLSREISGLAVTARHFADQQLPEVAEQLRNGEQVADKAAISQRPDARITEIAIAATAIASMQSAAVTAATAEAGLRNGLRQILISLGKRNQALLHRQLRIIDALEQQAPSPAALADLFTLDHLTTRMRRHAESLTIMSGAAPGRTWSGPVPVIDVIRAAVAEVEDYKRVTVLTDTEEAVTAGAVTDMIHLLAELVENATLFSPSSTRVEVRAERVANGFAVEVEDRGLGITQDQLSEINEQLANPPDFDLADADRLGLFVAGTLAARQGVHVSLCPSPYRGTRAVVVMPDSIVVASADPQVAARADAEPAIGGSARLNLLTPEALSLVGAARATSTLHSLPRRVRPANPSPQPENGTQSADHRSEYAHPHVASESPAPEHARSLAASLQNSWQRSRQANDTPNAGPTASKPPAQRQDATAPDSEEA